MIYPLFNDKPLVPSLSAYRELSGLGMDLEDACDVLKNGFDCARSRREVGKIERCLVVKERIRKIVAVEKENRYLIIHAGELKFSKKAKKRFGEKWQK